MHISVLQLTGEYALTDRQGQEVSDRIFVALSAGESVELDFIGVRVFSAPFFNYAIGQLLRDFDRQILSDRLKILNLAPWGQNLLEAVIKNAKQFYGVEDASVDGEVRL